MHIQIMEGKNNQSNEASEISTANIDQLMALLKIQSHELSETKKKLQLSNNQLEQFALVASHDLQEPLRKIKSFAGMLSDSNTSLSEKEKTYLYKIVSASERMTTLLHSVLGFSILVNQKEAVVLTDLNEIAKAVENDLEGEIQAKHVIINRELLPTIKAVPSQMVQLFSNLINNSIRFSKDDVSCVIDISTSVPTKEELIKNNMVSEGFAYVKLLFSDNGTGFNEQFSEQIFHIFRSVHDRKYKGAGIGLALCKRIVAHHEGAIFATSNEYSGAQFHVILPHQVIKH